MRITTRPGRMTTTNIKCGGSGKGRSVDSANWKRNGWESTNATGAVVSPIAEEVDLKANGHIKQVRSAVSVTGLFSHCSPQVATMNMTAGTEMRTTHLEGWVYPLPL